MPEILVSDPLPPKRPNVLKLSPPHIPQVPLIVKSEPQDYLMQQPQPSTTNTSQNESTSASSKRNRNNNNVIESLETGELKHLYIQFLADLKSFYLLQRKKDTFMHGCFEVETENKILCKVVNLQVCQKLTV